MEPTSPRPLPLWRTIALSVIATVRYFDYYLQISWAWMLLTFPCLVAANWLIFPFAAGDPRHRTTSRFVTGALADMLLTLPLLAVTAVGWHRFMIEGRRSEPTMRFNLDKPTQRYMVIALVYQSLIIIPLLIGGIVNDTGLMILVLVCFVLGFAATSRLSMLLPAVALERRGSDAAWAWNVARKQERVLIAGFTLTGILGFEAANSASSLLHAATPTTGPFGNAVFNAAQALLSQPLRILPPLAFLSLAYRHIVLIERQEKA